MYRSMMSLLVGLIVYPVAGCQVEERPPTAAGPPVGEMHSPSRAVEPAPLASPPPEHAIEITNPTDREVTIIAVVDGAEQEIGRVGPNRAARLNVVTQGRTTVRLSARDAYGRSVATGAVDLDGVPARWVIGD